MTRLVAVAAMVVPLAAWGAEAPHDEAFTDGNCNHCHSLYNPTVLGGTDYTAGCISCHGSRTGAKFGFPWLPGDQAKPGSGGAHHSWSGYAANPMAGAVAPAGLSRWLAGDQLQCATCHETHFASPQNAPGSQDTSMPIGVAQARLGGTAPTSSGMMKLVATGTAANGYRVKVTTNGTSFIVSHSAGKAAPVWLNWVSNAWSYGTDMGPGKPFTVGDTATNDVTLDDGVVKVRFTAAPAAGDYWDFYVSYPFMRVANTGDGVCVQCHASMAMTHLRVEGMDPRYPVNGVRLFSHPVGEGLNANGRGTDRTTILDATGVAQLANTGTTDADGNATNDLRLDGTVVRCTTCHAVHHADSNSLTTDLR